MTGFMHWWTQMPRECPAELARLITDLSGTAVDIVSTVVPQTSSPTTWCWARPAELDVSGATTFFSCPFATLSTSREKVPLVCSTDSGTTLFHIMSAPSVRQHDFLRAVLWGAMYATDRATDQTPRSLIVASNLGVAYDVTTRPGVRAQDILLHALGRKVNADEASVAEAVSGFVVPTHRFF